MNKLGGLLFAIILTMVGIWIFELAWNHGVVKATTIAEPIDFVTALLLVLVFFPGVLALGAGLVLLPAGILWGNNTNNQYMQDMDSGAFKPYYQASKNLSRLSPSYTDAYYGNNMRYPTNQMRFPGPD
jgi:hypothetical protein